ncbi:HAD family hydrolase [Puniceicoccus vermicola]|uniref:HAD-IA family hydrolase n=1 Tax=Puniceicoccus vermicola TaxID=388746 RepID=A0A7X1AYF3_9BACT|nr:HAD-IA family hydrolase [Puniceicoccus vermicola]MBC2602303.1 HAD-IA family hydrolase [Puniceicoccus vermicola]
MKPIRGIIFDMDGVLIDTVGFWADAEREVFSALGVRVTTDLAAITSGMTTAEVTDFWFERFPWDSPSKPAVEEKVISAVARRIREEGRAIPGACEWVRACGERGWKVGLATNSPRCLIPEVLRRLNLEDKFDAVISAEEVESGKPDPAIYRRALEKLGLGAEEAVVVEDSLTGAAAGVAAGCQTFLLGTDEPPIGDEKTDFFPISDFESLAAQVQLRK